MQNPGSDAGVFVLGIVIPGSLGREAGPILTTPLNRGLSQQPWLWILGHCAPWFDAAHRLVTTRKMAGRRFTGQPPQGPTSRVPTFPAPKSPNMLELIRSFDRLNMGVAVGSVDATKSSTPARAELSAIAPLD